MKIRYQYLQDKDFLDAVNSQHISQYYVKITVLDWEENPIQDIQGKVLTGNINLSGDSSVRRTASLSVIADNIINDLTNIQSLISINKKVYLQIGYKNLTHLKNSFPRYANLDYIWFPLGTYVIISPSISHSGADVIINVTLRDKMVLLNGECGGTIPASTIFDEYQTIDNNGIVYLTRPTIYQIIQQLVNHFGGEQLSKIIISDLQPYVKQVVQWKGNAPLYIVKSKQFAEDIIVTSSINRYQELINSGYIDMQGSPYQYGYDVGYIYTDFTYPGQLIGDAGSSVCDILDQILQTLRKFEYFYDIDGNFIFQQKKNYLNNSQAKTIISQLSNQGDINKNSYLLDMSKGKAVYQFNDSTLISSYNNSPKYNMIKNDFVIWGLRKTAEGQTLPIRYHLAIDKKPKIGNTYKCFAYEDPDDHLIKYHVPSQYSSFQDFPKKGAEEQFYLDLSTGKIYTWGYIAINQTYGYIETGAQIIQVTTKDWRTQLYFQGISAQPYGVSSNYYFTQLKQEWPKIYDIEKGCFKEKTLHSPTEIDFFLDFIDSNAAIGQFDVNNIGRRSLIYSDDKVNCIFQPEIPDIILIENNGEHLKDNPDYQRCIAQDQPFVLVDPTIYSVLAPGGILNSAYQSIRQMLHEYTSYNENISITSLPVYYLEPNTRITVFDPDSNIKGDYMIDSISFSFDSQGLMNINATRALEKI